MDMLSRTPRSVAGWMGLILLVAAWASVLSTPMFAQSRWVLRTFMIAAMVAFLVSFALGVAAARRSSKIWYLFAGVALLSELILLADLLVGD
jgi:FtsH-binding integral membrane protein